MDFEHREFGKMVTADFLQKDAEPFAAEGKRLIGEPKVVYDGGMVRKAIELKIILEPRMEPDEVEKLPPAKVRWMADNLARAFMEALSVPPA